MNQSQSESKVSSPGMGINLGTIKRLGYPMELLCAYDSLRNSPDAEHPDPEKRIKELAMWIKPFGIVYTTRDAVLSITTLILEIVDILKNKPVRSDYHSRPKTRTLKELSQAKLERIEVFKFLVYIYTAIGVDSNVFLRPQDTVMFINHIEADLYNIDERHEFLDKDDPGYQEQKTFYDNVLKVYNEHLLQVAKDVIVKYRKSPETKLNTSYDTQKLIREFSVGLD